MLNFGKPSDPKHKQILRKYQLIYNLLFDEDVILIIGKHWDGIYCNEKYKTLIIKECKNYEELFEWVQKVV